MENLPSYSSFINSPRPLEETNADKLPSYSSFMNGPTPPEEVGVVHGIARGLKSGLTQDLPSAAGKALQFVGAEEAGKSLTTFAEQNAVPEDQQGFWEKGARAIGAVLPMIVAGAVGNVAGVVAGVAGGAVFGLSQAHETEKALQERGIEPGIVPYLTGGATALAMTALPILTGRIFNGVIGSQVGKELSKQTAESVIRPSAGKILQDYGIKALETQLIFAGQTLSVAGIEKAYGVPREIASEMLESAKTGIAFSAFAAPGMAVRRAVDSSHLKTLANPWKPEDVASMPEQLQGKYLQRHAENRSGYAEAIGNALEKGGDPDTAKLWHDYAYKQIEKNEPIDTAMTLDAINLKAKLLEREVLDTSTTIKKGDAGENIGEVTVEKPPEPVVEEAVTKPILPIEETLPKVETAIPLKELNLSPALSVDGEIFKAGKNHGDIYNSVPKEKLESAKDLQTGYIDQTGKWYTDKEAREVISTASNLEVPPLIDIPVFRASSRHGQETVVAEYGSMGIHYGTKEQAQRIADYIPYPKKEGYIQPTVEESRITIKNPIRLTDDQVQHPEYIAKELQKRGLIDQDRVDEIGVKNSPEQDRRTINLLKSFGYDGIVYENIAEGKGDSYVVFDKSQIKVPEPKVVPAPEVKAEEPVLTEEQKKTAELEDKRQKASEDLVALDRDKPQKPKKGASVQEEAAYQNKLKDWKADREPLQKAMDEIDTTITASRETPGQKIAKDVNDALTALGKETEISKVEKVIADNPEETAAQITKRIVQSLPTKAKTVKTQEEKIPVHETEVGGVKVFKGDVRGNVDIGFKRPTTQTEVKAKIAADKAAKEEVAVVERKAGTQRMRERLTITTEPEHLDYVLSNFKDRLADGEGGGMKGTKDFGENVYLASGYPEWYQDMVKQYGNKKTAPILTKKGKAPGADADRLIAIIDKGMKGKKLDQGYEQQVWEDINRIADREATSGEYKGVLDQIREATNEWTGEKAKLAEEGADAGTVGAHIETATETLRSDLEAKGYSPEDVEIVIQELKNTALKPNETPKGDFKQSEIPEVKAKEDILSNPETEWSKPLPKQDITKNQDMFGTEEGLKKVAKDYADKTPDDKVKTAEDILKNDKITEEKGKITRDFCIGGK